MSETFISLLIFAAVTTLTPGGATALATASGSRFGVLRSLPLILGNVGGLTMLCAASAFDLGTLLTLVPDLTLYLQIAGSAYLIWLAWRIGTAGPPEDASDAEPMGPVAGLALLVVNPKAWTMAFGAAATFSTLSDNPAELALILGGVFGAFGVCALSLWAAGGALLARTLKTPTQWRILNGGLALLLILSVAQIWLT